MVAVQYNSHSCQCCLLPDSLLLQRLIDETERLIDETELDVSSDRRRLCRSDASKRKVDKGLLVMSTSNQAEVHKGVVTGRHQR